MPLSEIDHDDADEYVLSQWDSSGNATLTASGSTTPIALTAALSGLLVAMQPSAVQTASSSGRWAPLRAAAPDLNGLLPALFAATLDQMESLGQAIVTVAIDGLVRSDEGFIAWGMAELAHVPAGPLRSIYFLTPPDVVEQLSGVTISVSLVRTEGEGT